MSGDQTLAKKFFFKHGKEHMEDWQMPLIDGGSILGRNANIDIAQRFQHSASRPGQSDGVQPKDPSNFKGVDHI